MSENEAFAAWRWPIAAIVILCVASMSSCAAVGWQSHRDAVRACVEVRGVWVNGNCVPQARHD